MKDFSFSELNPICNKTVFSLQKRKCSNMENVVEIFGLFGKLRSENMLSEILRIKNMSQPNSKFNSKT